MTFSSSQFLSWQGQIGHELLWNNTDRNVPEEMQLGIEAASIPTIVNDISDHSEWSSDPFTLYTSVESNACFGPASSWHNCQNGDLKMIDETDWRDDEHPMVHRSANLKVAALTPPPSPSRDNIDTISETSTSKVAHPRRCQRRSSRRSGTASSSKDEHSPRQRARQMHTAVEQRYRDNLNGKLDQLSEALIASDSSSPFLSTSTSRRTRKSDILVDAVCYIHHSEVEIRHMSDEIRRLNEQVQALKNLMDEDKVMFNPVTRVRL